MTLAPDIIELAQQIADDLKERIDGLPMLFGSIFTKSHCCKNLIESLLGKHKIDTLLKSLPPHAAKSLSERYSRLMSCFDQTGELLNQDLPLETVARYMRDLIKELRNVGQGGKQSKAAVKQDEKGPLPKESKPIEKRFAFRPGQVLFDDRDLNVGTGAALDIMNALVENFGHVVPFQKFDENSLEREASEKTRTAIGRLRKAIQSARIPVVIESRKAEGYVMLPSSK